jgi:hypothetical protein
MINITYQNNMKTLKYLVVIALALGAFALSARANLIDLGIRMLPTALGNPADEAAFIEADQNLASGSLTYLNKFENSGNFGNDGAVDSSHFTAVLTDGGANGLVTWDLASTGFQLSYVFVKDGREAHGSFLYHLYGVTADQVFNSNGEQLVTINGRKGISHISFFGTPGGSSVPDAGSTVALLGLALLGIGIARRKFCV